MPLMFCWNFAFSFSKLFRFEYVIMLVIPLNFVSTINPVNVFLIIINIIEKCWMKLFHRLTSKIILLKSMFVIFLAWYQARALMKYNEAYLAWLLLNNLCRLLVILAKSLYYHISSSLSKTLYLFQNKLSTASHLFPFYFPSLTHSVVLAWDVLFFFNHYVYKLYVSYSEKSKLQHLSQSSS